MSRGPPRHARLDVTAALCHAPHVASSDARIFCASLPIELLALAGHTGPHGPPSAQAGSHSPAPAAYKSQRGGGGGSGPFPPPPFSFPPPPPPPYPFSPPS